MDIAKLIDLAVERVIDKRKERESSETIKPLFQIFALCSMLAAIVIVFGIWGAMDPSIAIKASLSLIAVWIPLAIILAIHSRSASLA